MNIKELIDEFYSWRPLPPPEETGLLEPLKLEDLPRAIQMLKAYEVVKAPYETVPLVRTRVGEFITDYLVKNGLEGAERIADVFKATRRKGPRNEYDELAHIGRVLFAWLRFSKDRTDAAKLPTKRQFRELVLRAFSYKQAEIDLDLVQKIAKGQEIFDRETVWQRAEPYFTGMQKRFEHPTTWRRIVDRMGVGELPDE